MLESSTTPVFPKCAEVTRVLVKNTDSSSCIEESDAVGLIQ